MAQRKRQQVTVTLDPDLLEWVRGKIGGGGPYKDLSHALDRALQTLREREDKIAKLLLLEAQAEEERWPGRRR